MSLCVDGQHRWDAQVALRKGGVEPGDRCDCGAVQFGTAAERYAHAADLWAGRASNWHDATPLSDEEVAGLLRNAEQGIAVGGCYFRLLKTLVQARGLTSAPASEPQARRP